MPSPAYHSMRWSSQCSCHRWASAGGTKNSISICSNSSVRKTKLPGVISLRNDFPTCAIPNGGSARGCEVAARILTRQLRRRAAAVQVVRLRAGLGLIEVVGAEAQLAGAAVDERVGEPGE